MKPISMYATEDKILHKTKYLMCKASIIFGIVYILKEICSYL